MNCQLVTFTGADQTIEPEQLVEISKEFPEVEWAILFSQSKSGVSRYPSLDWVERLVSLALETDINLSAHLVGKWVDDTINGNYTFFNDHRWNTVFKRVQFNLSKGRLASVIKNPSKIFEVCQELKQRCILGGNFASLDVDASKFVSNNASPLFDASGGNGVLTKDWPISWTVEEQPIFCGYAGGLGPDNIREEFLKIKEKSQGDFWIDMESKIRNSQDKFDLEKCKTVLDIVRELNG